MALRPETPVSFLDHDLDLELGCEAMAVPAEAALDMAPAHRLIVGG
jgi:hypothetical protein